MCGRWWCVLDGLSCLADVIVWVECVSGHGCSLGGIWR